MTDSYKHILHIGQSNNISSPTFLSIWAVDVRDIYFTKTLSLDTSCAAMLFHCFSNAWIDVEDSVKICVEWTPSTSLLLHVKVQELAHVVTN